MYEKFDILCEQDRLYFILDRDGLEAAVKFARDLINIYLIASLNSRIKFRTRKYPYRFKYIESAYSARYILNNNLLQLKAST